MVLEHCRNDREATQKVDKQHAGGVQRSPLVDETQSRSVGASMQGVQHTEQRLWTGMGDKDPGQDIVGIEGHAECLRCGMRMLASVTWRAKSPWFEHVDHGVGSTPLPKSG